MFPSHVLDVINEAKKLATYNQKKTIDERLMKIAIRLTPGGESVLRTANKNEKNLSKSHLDMFNDAIRPLRSSAKAKMMIGGLLVKSARKSPSKSTKRL